MTIRLAFKSDASTAAFRRLKSQAPIAIARALNRTAASGRTAIGRDIAADLKIKVGTVRDKIQIVDATPARHVATFYASAKRIPAIEFNARGPEPSRGLGRGVSLRLPVGRVPSAFIVTFASGKRGVFIRAGASSRRSRGAWSKNLPIVELFGPSIANVFEKHRGAGIARFQEQLPKNIAHELRFALTGVAA